MLLHNFLVTSVTCWATSGLQARHQPLNMKLLPSSYRSIYQVKQEKMPPMFISLQRRPFYYCPMQTFTHIRTAKAWVSKAKYH